MYTYIHVYICSEKKSFSERRNKTKLGSKSLSDHNPPQCVWDPWIEIPKLMDLDEATEPLHLRASR